jgi:hypothetical protein
MFIRLCTQSAIACALWTAYIRVTGLMRVNYVSVALTPDARRVTAMATTVPPVVTQEQKRLGLGSVISLCLRNTQSLAP